MQSRRQRSGILTLIRQRSARKASEEPVSVSASKLTQRGLQSSEQISRALAPPTVPYVCSFCKSVRLRCHGRPLRMFFYEELRLATGNFSYDNYLAETKSGHIFRGTLEGGDVVAVKITNDDLSFRTQRIILDNISSVNVVGLIGFCDERPDRRLLVYDFICNGSLEWHLTGSQKVLPWAWRKSIAIGIARGLKYLHESCSIELSDLRSQNILLTHDYTPMIAGMGTAKLKMQTRCSLSTSIEPGNVVPEENGRSDVYSYGIILLELITGRKSFDSQQASPLLREVDHEKLVDSKLDCQYNHYELLTMMTVASLCLRSNPLERPSSTKILSLLEDDADRVFTSSEDGGCSRSDSTLSQASSLLPWVETLNLKPSRTAASLTYSTML